MRLVSILAAALIVVLTGVIGAIELAKKDPNVPSVLEARIGEVVSDLEVLSRDFQKAYTYQPNLFSEQEWRRLGHRYMLAAFKVNSAAISIELCKDLSQGSYCDIAGSDLTEAESEIKALKKASLKFANVEVKS